MKTFSHLCKALLLSSSAALSLGLGQAASAHTDEYLDTVTAPHGGQLRMSGAYHFELVVKKNELVIYLTDHGKTPIPSAGASGSATLLSSKGKTRIKLAPAGDNVLRGTGPFETAPDLKVTVAITLPGQAAQSARFTPYRKLTDAKPASPATKAPDHRR